MPRSTDNARPLTTASVEPGLVDGQRLDQTEFRRRNSQRAPEFRVELVDGVVCVSESTSGRPGSLINHWMFSYWEETPGVHSSKGATTILGTSEVRPNALMMIEPACGGRVTVSDDDLLIGVPELIVEFAKTNESVELNAKYHLYEWAGVAEYVVVLPQQRTVRWFVREADGYHQLNANDGVLKSRKFPGLWLTPEDLFVDNPRGLTTTLKLGLAQPEHALFVERLERMKSPRRMPNQ